MIDMEQVLTVLGLLALGLLIRFLRRPRRRRPALTPPTDAPSVIADELVRVLAGPEPDPPRRDVKESVRVLLIEIERRAGEDD
jgi:hypothetical protein